MGDAVHPEGASAPDDADALRASNAELARSNRDLAEMASIAAHDLKSPLTTIGGFAQLLRQRPSVVADADALAYVERISAGVVRLTSLIDDLLLYSQFGSGYSEHEVETSAVVAEVVDALAADVADAGAEIAVAELPAVMGDAFQLRQLFQNLLGNAIKFRHPDRPPRVDVAAERDGGRWTFAVADNGIGIDESQRDRVFAMFQRLHARTEYPGTGMGLSICRRIVENHGGDIWIEPSPTDGTTFRFTLCGVRRG